MACLKCKVNIPSTPLTPNVPKTIGQLKAPANQRLKILGFSLTFNGSTAQLPIQIRFLRQSSAGTSLVAATPVPIEEGIPETPQATAQVGSQTTQTEPSNTAVLKTVFLPGYSGEEYLETPGNEDQVKGGGYYGIEATNPTGNATISVAGHILYEE
jgi:hypothetical protein